MGRIPRPPKSEHGSYSKDIKPGFLHIDSFKLFRVVGQSVAQVCFVAVDRATRMVLVAPYDRHDIDAACDFLAKCQRHFPFALHTIVTDNGAEYTLKASAPAKHAKGFRRPFEVYCSHAEIEHRTTKPYTPKTNGLSSYRANERRGLKPESFAEKNTCLSPSGTWRLAPGTTTITETERIETYQLAG